jgi:hypothetical protein
LAWPIRGDWKRIKTKQLNIELLDSEVASISKDGFRTSNISYYSIFRETSEKEL